MQVDLEEPSAACHGTLDLSLHLNLFYQKSTTIPELRWISHTMYGQYQRRVVLINQENLLLQKNPLPCL